MAKILVLSLGLLAASACSAAKATETVSGLWHAAIRTAIDAVAANADGGKVVVPAGTYECEGSIELKSKVELNLASGAIPWTRWHVQPVRR